MICAFWPENIIISVFWANKLPNSGITGCVLTVSEFDEKKLFHVVLQ